MISLFLLWLDIAETANTDGGVVLSNLKDDLNGRSNIVGKDMLLSEHAQSYEGLADVLSHDENGGIFPARERNDRCATQQRCNGGTADVAVGRAAFEDRSGLDGGGHTSFLHSMEIENADVGSRKAPSGLISRIVRPIKNLRRTISGPKERPKNADDISHVSRYDISRYQTAPEDVQFNQMHVEQKTEGSEKLAGLQIRGSKFSSLSSNSQ